MTTIGVFVAIFDHEGRVLCVHRNYGPFNWTTPGGRLDSSESSVEGICREVREETGFVVAVKEFVGCYSWPAKDDLVLFFEAVITGREAWQPNDEISEVGFFLREALPQPFSFHMYKRLDDALAGKKGVLHVFDDPLNP